MLFKGGSHVILFIVETLCMQVIMRLIPNKELGFSRHESVAMNKSCKQVNCIMPGRSYKSCTAPEPQKLKIL